MIRAYVMEGPFFFLPFDETEAKMQKATGTGVLSSRAIEEPT